MRFRLPSRRGASSVEAGFATLFLVAFAWGIWCVTTLLWSQTVLSTTSDTAALSAAVAYDSWRFGEGALGTGTDGANEAIAIARANESADAVINALRLGGPYSALLNLDRNPGSCAAGRPQSIGSSVTAGPDTETPIIAVGGTGRYLRKVKVSTWAGWTPTGLRSNSGVFPNALTLNACMRATTSIYSLGSQP